MNRFFAFAAALTISATAFGQAPIGVPSPAVRPSAGGLPPTGGAPSTAPVVLTPVPVPTTRPIQTKPLPGSTLVTTVPLTLAGDSQIGAGSTLKKGQIVPDGSVPNGIFENTASTAFNSPILAEDVTLLYDVVLPETFPLRGGTVFQGNTELYLTIRPRLNVPVGLPSGAILPRQDYPMSSRQTNAEFAATAQMRTDVDSVKTQNGQILRLVKDLKKGQDDTNVELSGIKKRLDNHDIRLDELAKREPTINVQVPPAPNVNVDIRIIEGIRHQYFPTSGGWYWLNTSANQWVGCSGHAH